MRPRAGPLQASSETTMSPDLAGGLGHVADRLRVVALGAGDAVDRLEDCLLEAAALGGAALALGLDLIELVLLVAQRLQLLLELAELLQQRR